MDVALRIVAARSPLRRRDGKESSRSKADTT
jgi:hypothetical protein